MCERCEAIGMTPGPGLEGRLSLAGQRLTRVVSHGTLLEYMLNDSKAQCSHASMRRIVYVFESSRNFYKLECANCKDNGLKDRLGALLGTYRIKRSARNGSRD